MSDVLDMTKVKSDCISDKEMTAVTWNQAKQVKEEAIDDGVTVQR